MQTQKTIVSIIHPLEMAGFIKTNGTQCRFAVIVTDTPVEKIKKNNPFPGLRKVSRKFGIINANYNNSVRRRIAERLGVELKEVEYEAGTTWYEHLTTKDNKPLPLVQHKNEAKRNGKYYLQYFPQKAVSVYVLPNGDTVADSLVEPYLYATSARSDFKPAVIAVELSNIKEIRLSGVIMQAEDLDAAEAVLQE